MQITIDQDELEAAVRDYVKNQGLSQPVGSIDFTVTRGQGSGNKVITEIHLGEVELAVKTPPAIKAVDTTESEPGPSEEVPAGTLFGGASAS